MQKRTGYQISTTLNEEVVEFVITGLVTEDFFENVQDKISEAIESNNARKLLFDVSALQIPHVFSEAYSRMIVNYPPLLHIKSALVDIPENAEFQKFHEMQARNAGMSFKWFTDIDEARVWLNMDI
ncbi:MAG: hypothetical protein WBN66_09595 [Smithella sp.]